LIGLLLIFQAFVTFQHESLLGKKVRKARGVDTDRALALEKSVAEAIERLIFYKNQNFIFGFCG
jgi:hypothetical protein